MADFWKGMLRGWLIFGLTYPDAVELADFWQGRFTDFRNLSLDILVPLSLLIFGKLGLDIPAPDVWKGGFRHPNIVELAHFWKGCPI